MSRSAHPDDEYSPLAGIVQHLFVALTMSPKGNMVILLFYEKRRPAPVSRKDTVNRL